MSFQIGDTVGPYKITSVVGRGGMGRVFKVEHAVTLGVEAMKVLAQGEPHDPQVTQRFLREIQVQASLHHPNIASVHHAFFVGGDLVMAMELIEGECLEQLLGYGRLPCGLGIDYIHQALSALSYAHSRGVTHRDIKPANMIITPEGILKLTDFGLARGSADILRLTQSGMLMGSAYYMSPEQIRGVAALDARTDIYSLGAVLYEVVTGRKPFDRDGAFEIMRAHIEEEPAPPVHMDASVPPALNEVILRALAKDPEKRFPSAEAFRDALEPFLPAPRPRDAARGGTSPRSHFSRRQIGTLTALIAALLAAVGIWQPRSARNLRPQGENPIAKQISAAGDSPDRTTDIDPLTPKQLTDTSTQVSPQLMSRTARAAPRRNPVVSAGIASSPAPEDGAAAVDLDTVRDTEKPNPPLVQVLMLQPQTITLPRGTVLKVRNLLDLSTSTHKSGEDFTLALDDALVVNDRLIAAKGATAKGEIVEADKGGRVKGRARLSVRLTRLQTANGAFVPISTKPIELLGGPRPVVPLMRSSPAVLPGERRLNFDLLIPVVIAEQ